MVIQQQLDCALKAARTAGDLLRGAFRQGYHGDLDNAAELLIRGILLGAFPDYGYLGEETGWISSRGDVARHLWLVDPLDGTSAATRGFRGAAVSIALLREGVPVVGVVYAYAAPDCQGDLFWWCEGSRGIVRNGREVNRVWPAELTSSGTALISQDAYEMPSRNHALVAPMRYRPVPGIAYRLALVAAGEGDVAISLNSPTSWDFGGGHALLLGAGGNLFDQEGRIVSYDSEGRVKNSLSACFGGQRGIVTPLIDRDWKKIRTASRTDSAAAKLSYLLPKLVVDDAGVLGRAQGCLLGQLAGDALGSLVEFQTAATIQSKYPDGPRFLADGGSWHTIAGQPTDDSELALALARSIVASGGYDEDATARAYAGWYASAPFDIGTTTRSALGPARRAEQEGLSAASAAKAAASATSQANGALMRISPLGIFGVNVSTDLIVQYARTDASLTHPHPVCQDANAVFAATLAFAIQSGEGPTGTYEFAVSLATILHVAAPVIKALQDAAVDPPRDYYSLQGWVLIALQNAFYQLLHAGFEDGVVNTVRAGGDTDTNGAIVGALLGAVHGRASVPLQWLDRVLTCRPISGLRGVVHPRPPEYWPVDALCLAERLVLAGK